MTLSPDEAPGPEIDQEGGVSTHGVNNGNNDLIQTGHGDGNSESGTDRLIKTTTEELPPDHKPQDTYSKN